MPFRFKNLGPLESRQAWMASPCHCRLPPAACRWGSPEPARVLKMSAEGNGRQGPALFVEDAKDGAAALLKLIKLGKGSE